MIEIIVHAGFKVKRYFSKVSTYFNYQLVDYLVLVVSLCLVYPLTS